MSPSKPDVARLNEEIVLPKSGSPTAATSKRLPPRYKKRPLLVSPLVPLKSETAEKAISALLTEKMPKLVKTPRPGAAVV